MMSTQEFKLVNANDKLEVEIAQSYQEQFTKLKTEVMPKDYQGIAMNGYIIFEGNYNSEAIVTYRIPRKVDYEFDKFPKEIKEDVQQKQKEYNLNKKQIKELHNQIKGLDLKLDKQNEILNNIIKDIVNKDKSKKQLNNFYKLYSKFFESLSCDLSYYDLESKNEIKVKLIKLVHLIEDVINYLE